MRSVVGGETTDSARTMAGTREGGQHQRKARGSHEALTGWSSAVNKKAHLGEVDFFSLPWTGGCPVQDNLIIVHKVRSWIGARLGVA
jgi:hypothetical protein